VPNSNLEPFKDLIRDLGQRDARNLELMATTLFLSESARSVNESNIVKNVKDLKSEQKYDDAEIGKSVAYLYNHGFLQKPESEKSLIVI
jgi:hypothetical protein